MNRILALILFILLLPLLLIIALLIKLSSKGPIIYKQVRVGLHNKNFTIYKFRTMLLENEVIKKADKKDNRLTKIGKILRNSHLDELLQLINIMKGEMNFIGPRPERPELVEEFKQVIKGYNVRHLVKPGITGLAQVNASYDADIELKNTYDMIYINNQDVIMDCMIIFFTFGKLFDKYHI